MTLDKHTNFLKNRYIRFWKNRKKRKIAHVNVHFRFSDFNQELAILLLIYIEPKFRIWFLLDLWLRNAWGYIHTRTYVRSDQWTFGHFLASGDHNIRFYVLNPVSNYYGHRFLPPRSYKMKLIFFIFQIQALK